MPETPDVKNDVQNEIMNAFIKLVPYLSVLFDNEASFALTVEDLIGYPCALIGFSNILQDIVVHFRHVLKFIG